MSQRGGLSSLFSVTFTLHILPVFKSSHTTSEFEKFVEELSSFDLLHLSDPKHFMCCLDVDASAENAQQTGAMSQHFAAFTK